MKFKFKMLYIWFTLPVIFVALWIFAFYMPFSAQIKQKEKELLNLKQEQQKIEGDIKNAVDVKRRGDQIKSSIVDMQMQLPTIEDFPDFMIGILKDVKKEGVSLNGFSSNFSSLENRPGLLLIHPVFDMSLKGRFINMGKFLDDLDERKVYKGITKAKISYDEKEYPILTGKFTVEFTARRSGSLEKDK